jgi:hypothetical protein
MMTKSALTEGSVRHEKKGSSDLKPVSPPPQGNTKKCCGGDCKDNKTDTTVIKRKHGKCLKDGGCDGDPLELKCIHSDVIFAAFVMVSIASAVFGLGLGMALYAIANGASFGHILVSILAMAIGGVCSVALWSTLPEGIKVYKKIMRED